MSPAGVSAVPTARHMLCLPGFGGLARLAPFAEVVYRLHQADGVVGNGLPGPQSPGVPAPQGLVAGWPTAPGETQALLAYASHSKVPAGPQPRSTKLKRSPRPSSRRANSCRVPAPVR